MCVTNNQVRLMSFSIFFDTEFDKKILEIIQSLNEKTFELMDKKSIEKINESMLQNTSEKGKKKKMVNFHSKYFFFFKSSKNLLDGTFCSQNLC